MTEIEEGGELALQDHVLVEAEIDGRPLSFRTVVVKIAPEELWLGLASPDPRLEQLRPGHPVSMTVARFGFALLGRSRVIRHLGESRSRIFALAPAATLERAQRRAHLRVPVDMETRFRMVDPVTGEARGKTCDGTTLDAGPGGLLIRTDVPLGVGDSVELTLSLSGSERLSATARVARIREGEPAAADQPATLLVGLKFTRITSVDRQRILKTCMLIQHRRRAARESVPSAASVEGSLPAVPPASPAPVPDVPPAPAAAQHVALDPALAEAVSRARAAQAARLAKRAAAQTVSEAPAAAAQRPLAPVPATPAELPPGTPLVQIGLALCETAGVPEVRRWFDNLEPFNRIGLLSNLQANMHGEAVDGASEPFVVQSLAQALGLIQKTA
jgi:c-di-GMP-binding flagellar brake protein YcgR